MLIVFKLLVLTGIWYIFPTAVGFVVEKQSGAQNIDFLQCYLKGIIILFGLFYLIARIVIMQKLSLSVLTEIWCKVMILVIILALAFIFWKRKEIRLSDIIREVKKLIPGILVVIILTVFSVGAVTVSQKDNTVESVLTMYTFDTLYQINPMTGKAPMLPVEKELLAQMAGSPLDAYYAVCLKICNLNPAKFIRMILPFFMFPIYYAVYVLWARFLFPGEKAGKRYLFLAMIWVLYAIPLAADKAFYFSVFQNEWNGEPLFFLALLPWSILQIFGKEKELRSLKNYASVLVLICYVASALAGQLMYEKGFFMITFAWVAVIVMTGIMRWKNGSSI